MLCVLELLLSLPFNCKVIIVYLIHGLHRSNDNSRRYNSR
jgi:hypothetical protein